MDEKDVLELIEIQKKVIKVVIADDELRELKC